MIHPTFRGHFVARVDGNIKLSNYFDEMRLKRSLRPLRFEAVEATEVSDAREITQ